jgi:hypothetical protein
LHFCGAIISERERSSEDIPMQRHIPAGSARLAAVERWLGENTARLEKLEEALLGHKGETAMADPATVPAITYSIIDWCQEAGFGKSTYYLEARDGRGPKTTKVRGRTLIIESPAAWYQRRQRAAEEGADAPVAA